LKYFPPAIPQVNNFRIALLWFFSGLVALVVGVIAGFAAGMASAFLQTFLTGSYGDPSGFAVPAGLAVMGVIFGLFMITNLVRYLSRTARS
jgi:ABC-type thiamin/hydroxymethylpyrimidine transport system permease subunit